MKKIKKNIKNKKKKIVKLRKKLQKENSPSPILDTALEKATTTFSGTWVLKEMVQGM